VRSVTSWVSWLVGLLALQGCHTLLPFEPGQGGGDAAVEASYPPCVVASAGCWDVRASFTLASTPANVDHLRIFGENAAVRQVLHGVIGADDKPPEVLSETCSITGNPYTYRRGWFIWRTTAGGPQLHVAGESMADCLGPLQRPHVAGYVEVNPARGWTLELRSKEVQLDSLSPAKEPVTTTATRVDFDAGSYCGLGCCACNDGGRVKLELAVTRR